MSTPDLETRLATLESLVQDLLTRLVRLETLQPDVLLPGEIEEEVFPDG